MTKTDQTSNTRLSEALTGPQEVPAVKGNIRQTRDIVQRQKKLRDILSRVLTGEVIPRVFEANGGAAKLNSVLDRNARDEFRACVLKGPLDACADFVQKRIDEGVSLRSMCLGLFTLTAQELGELWDADIISFAEVTIGLGRLHKLVHHFSALDADLKSAGVRHNIILASAPEEQHAFGVLLVSKIFEMEGWLVTGGPDLHTGADLVSLVHESWFDIIGLSASSKTLAQSLKQDIAKMRKASLNPDVFVIVGGAGFADAPELIEEIGADDVANNADDAILKARELLEARSDPEGL